MFLLNSANNSVRRIRLIHIYMFNCLKLCDYARTISKTATLTLFNLIKLLTYLIVVKDHFELSKQQPTNMLIFVCKIHVFVFCLKTKGMEFFAWV